MKFQDKLLSLRKEKGISQERLAEIDGISRQAVVKWEAGQSYPDIDKLIILSDFFKTSIDKLVKDEDDENCSFKVTTKNNYVDEKILDFLCCGKKAAYAGKGAECKATRPNSHDLQYSENDLRG